jgi:hypothetical protein
VGVFSRLELTWLIVLKKKYPKKTVLTRGQLVSDLPKLSTIEKNRVFLLEIAVLLEKLKN